MKEEELRKAANCAICGKPFGHTGLPMFRRITIERIGLDLKAVQRQQGLTMILGGHAALANIMGPDEEMTVPIGDPIKVTVCEDCASKKISINEIAERAEGENEKFISKS